MKKLLLLASILAMSGVAFAAASDEEDLKVQATIIKPLKVTTADVNFGIVAAGQKNVVTIGTSGDGAIEVTGEAEKNVKFSVDGLGSTEGVGSTLYLENESGSTLLAGLLAKNPDDDGDYSGLDFFFNKSYQLLDSGSKKFIVSGIIYDVPEDATPGLYTGSVKVKAEYDFSSEK